MSGHVHTTADISDVLDTENNRRITFKARPRGGCALHTPQNFFEWPLAGIAAESLAVVLRINRIDPTRSFRFGMTRIDEWRRYQLSG